MPNLSNIVSAIGTVPAGAVMSFAMSAAPVGWHPCDGSTVTRTGSGANLFAAIGTIHGSGNGSTTFNVPDLRGYFIRGSGTNGDGTASGTFGAKMSASDIYNNYSFSRVPDLDNAVFNGDGTTTRNVQVINVTNTGLTTTSKDYTKVRPANIALLYCIKL